MHLIGWNVRFVPLYLVHSVVLRFYWFIDVDTIKPYGDSHMRIRSAEKGRTAWSLLRFDTLALGSFVLRFIFKLRLQLELSRDTEVDSEIVILW